MNQLNIGIAGLGTVGSGVVNLILTHNQLHLDRSGKKLHIAAVSALEMPEELSGVLEQTKWFDDPMDLANSADIDVVIELIGGEEGIARKLVESSLIAGKSVVTANKALIAHHGSELLQLAEIHNVSLMFEASVAGGIPILRSLREGLVANSFDRVYGILNGTCNYILSEMADTGRDFSSILSEAQSLGFAEANPSTDVDGFDAAHKLSILSSLAFGTQLNFSGVFIEGIRNIRSLDIEFAHELGYCIKLLGITKRSESEIEQRVHPCMIHRDTPIAKVNGVLNAVVAEGDHVGQVVFEGAGAGQKPTASAVVGDIVDIARGRTSPPFSIPSSLFKNLNTQSMSERFGAYYIRLIVHDQSGVLAEAADVFAEEKVSIETVLQRGRDPKSTVPLILTTHDTDESSMMKVFSRLEQLKAVVEKPALIRIENFS